MNERVGDFAFGSVLVLGDFRSDLVIGGGNLLLEKRKANQMDDARFERDRSQRMKIGRPRKGDLRMEEFALMRVKKIIAYLRDGWSVSSACAMAGVFWPKVRGALVKNEEFYNVYLQHVKNAKRRTA